MKKFIKFKINQFLILGLLTLTNNCLCYSKVTNHNKFDYSFIFANILAAPVASLMGYGVYKLAKNLNNKTKLNLPAKSADYFTAALGAGFALFSQKYLSYFYHLILTEKKIINERIHELFNLIDLNLTYLAVTKQLRYELQYELENSLDTTKYHATGVESRLQILDAAFFTLKNSSLIPKLEKCGRYNLEHISSFIKQTTEHFKNEEFLEEQNQINSKLNLLCSDKKIYERNELLGAIKLHGQQEIFDLLSEYFIHLDTFSSGFNRGIDIIDEAHMVNSFAHKLLDLINSKCSRSLANLNKEFSNIKTYTLIGKLITNNFSLI